MRCWQVIFFVAVLGWQLGAGVVANAATSAASHAPQARGCKSHCYAVLLAGFGAYIKSRTAAVVAPTGQLTNIGNAIASYTTGSIALQEKIAANLSERTKTLAQEQHAKKIKVAGIDVRKASSAHFGVVDRGTCMQAELSAQQLSGARRSYQGVAREVSQQLDELTKSPATKRRVWAELESSADEIANTFLDPAPASEIDKLMALGVKAVSQSNFYPAPRDQRDQHQAQYNRWYQDFSLRTDIVRDALSDHVHDSSYQHGEAMGLFVDDIAARANISPHGSSTDDIVQAIGHSRFGNKRDLEAAAISGTELLRMLLAEFAKRQFLLAKNAELVRSMANFSALRHGLESDEFFTPRLDQAYTALN
ncbi:MAG: hypothetical protein AAF197_07395 [Pseudomonadota bacterium]